MVTEIKCENTIIGRKGNSLYIRAIFRLSFLALRLHFPMNTLISLPQIDESSKKNHIFNLFGHSDEVRELWNLRRRSQQVTTLMRISESEEKLDSTISCCPSFSMLNGVSLNCLILTLFSSFAHKDWDFLNSIILQLGDVNYTM